MKIKEFFQTVWYYITYPYYRLSTKKIDKKLKEIAAEDRAAILDENDVEFFKSIGIDTDLETLKNDSKSAQIHKKF